MAIKSIPAGYSSSLVSMWGLEYKESWVLKNWCFWTVVLKTFESPWTARRANQSILKEVSPQCSLEGLTLKLKLQYFGHLMQTVNSLEKTLMLGKIEGRRRKGWQRMKWLDGIINSMDISLSKTPGDSEGQEGLACCSPWGRKDLGTTDQLNNSLTSNSQVVMCTWVRGGRTGIQSPLYSAIDLIFPAQILQPTETTCQSQTSVLGMWNVFPYPSS